MDSAKLAERKRDEDSTGAMVWDSEDSKHTACKLDVLAFDWRHSTIVPRLAQSGKGGGGTEDCEALGSRMYTL